MSNEPYPPYQPPGTDPEATEPDELGANGPWRVAIEYSNQGQAKPPTIVQIGRSTHGDRATALLAAKRAAFEFDPPDPWAPQGREVFRDGPDAFLVVIHGATSTFHMSVRIVSAVSQ